jgi:hypothetical protein
MGEIVLTKLRYIERTNNLLPLLTSAPGTFAT